MSEIQEPGVRQVDPQGVARAAQACLTILNHDQGVIPNKVRRDVEALERLMLGFLQGQLVVVQAPEQRQQVPTPETPEMPPEE
jgi:hypothetical protein